MSVELYNFESKEYEMVGVGATLKVWRDNSYRIMSDVWGSADMAIYWDAKEKRPKTVCVNVYDYGNEKARHLEVDATPEVKEAYRNYLIGLKYSSLLEEAEAESVKPVKGCKVKVVSGRNAKGAEGIVAVSIERPYGMGYRSYMATKLGIATSDVKVKVAAANGKVYENYRDMIWVWAKNVARVEPAPIDKEEILKLATESVNATFKAS